MAAHDAILEHRMDQTFHANRKRRESDIYAVDNRVYLSRQTLTLPKGRARKLVPQYMGPYRAEMITTFRCVQAQRRIDNPKLNRFGIHPSTPGDMVPVLQSWQHNPEGVPLPIRGKSDGTLNTSDIDVWMWLKRLSPKSRPPNTTQDPPVLGSGLCKPEP
jgi:hypothetical protein